MRPELIEFGIVASYSSKEHSNSMLKCFTPLELRIEFEQLNWIWYTLVRTLDLMVIISKDKKYWLPIKFLEYMTLLRI